MNEKFGLEFKTPPTTGTKEFTRYWQEEKFLLCSINLAKSAKALPLVSARSYDLVVVDEAHHCKNKTSRNWQAVNALQKRFMLLLTATPVQNNLLELYNLITLLKPGQLNTDQFFKKHFISGKDLKKPKQKEDLRGLLSEVMIRNTRSSVNIGLPKRWAHTFRAEPSEIELQLYSEISNFVRLYYGKEKGGLDRLTLTVLQQEAGSSPAALLKTLNKLLTRTNADNTSIDADLHGSRGLGTDLRGQIQVGMGKDGKLIDAEVKKSGRKKSEVRVRKKSAKEIAGISRLIELAKSAVGTAKANMLLDIIRKNQNEKVLVFTHFQETLAWLADFLRKQGIESVEFHGRLSAAEKDEAIEKFRTKTNILLCTESGGEGKNLQFCNTLVNFDLPWNPMRIEQRIGRIHRFGQTREVFVFNLALKNSVEDYLLRILDEKINMFELVVGEIDMIVGKLEEESSLEDLIMDIWTGNTEADQGFESLSQQMIQAKKEYLQSKELDRELFEKDYEV